LRRVLNNLDELLRLVDGVVVGVDDLNADAESRGYFGYCDCLLGLVIVLSGGVRATTTFSFSMGS